MTFDVIVIGSGFGGAITGCRLAENGFRVLILERGRRWTRETFPSKTHKDWIWNQEKPERENGWVDFRLFPHMAVVQGAAVGGGSLIYANVSVEAPKKVFTSPWPAEITYDELKPHYDAVAKFMNVQTIPLNQLNPRTILMQKGAKKIGREDRFGMLPLAVTFDLDLVFDVEHPPDESKSKEITNDQGVKQGTCIHAGLCDIGCPVLAKNTLDLNYIPRAEQKGAEVRSLHLVTNIEPIAGGYRVSFDRLEGGRRKSGSETARIVIVAAGSLGSTELLLRCRDVKGSLHNISRFLGRNWSSNGGFLTPAFYADRTIYADRGPTISSVIDLHEGANPGESFWVEDGGFPNLFGSLMKEMPLTLSKGLEPSTLIEGINQTLRDPGILAKIMPWFSQGIDAGDGVLELKRPWWFFGPRQLNLRWDVTKSLPVFEAIANTHKKLAKKTDGEPLLTPGWTFSRDLITPHALGGCNMGNTPQDGVVNHLGEVFGFRNLFVADGAIIPTALGVNPSRTIGALAERIAKQIVTEGR